MHDMYELIKTLSPERQKKFYDEQAKIKEDCERIEAWCHRTEEAMKLTPEQIAFIRENNITICTAYIGMVRFYINNLTIFQTSAMAPILDSLFNTQSVVNYDLLTKQTHEYLNYLMAASPELLSKLLSRNVPLFG